MISVRPDSRSRGDAADVEDERVVDLSRVHQLASPAPAGFLWAHRICRARGGTLLLRGADRRTHDMLRRTGLSHVLQVQPGTGERLVA